MADVAEPGPPYVVTLPAGEFRIDRASRDDVSALVALLRDDPLGSARETGPSEPYLAAFDLVDRDPAHLLVAVRALDEAVVATAHLTLLPGLSRGGALRMQVEAVRVATDLRGSGLGGALLGWTADWGRAHGASLAQLTSDRTRTDAHRFYERLGWVGSHVGMKLDLAAPPG